MVFPKARLAVSALLFVAWIGFLGYLVVRTRHPVILSRPQLSVSSLVVVADVLDKDGKPDATVTIKKVAWATATEHAKLVGTHLKIDGLAECRKEQGWAGPSEYVVPLLKRGTEFEVTPLPVSPGYYPLFVTVELERVGPEKEKVADLVAKFLGKGGEISRGILARNVPREKAYELKEKLLAVHAGAKISEGESRIYRATPDALEQLEELKAKQFSQ
jgi:hypothetical protein